MDHNSEPMIQTFFEPLICLLDLPPRMLVPAWHFFLPPGHLGELESNWRDPKVFGGIGQPRLHRLIRRGVSGGPTRSFPPPGGHRENKDGYKPRERFGNISHQTRGLKRLGNHRLKLYRKASGIWHSSHKRLSSKSLFGLLRKLMSILDDHEIPEPKWRAVRVARIRGGWASTSY